MFTKSNLLKKILYIFLVLSYICCFRLQLRSQGVNITNYTIRDGLPQNNINRLGFDKDNNLWIGTNGGLSMYNGQAFFTIKHDRLNPRIIHLHYDKFNECINIIDEKSSVFKYCPTQNKIRQLKYFGNFKNILFERVAMTDRQNLSALLNPSLMNYINNLDEKEVICYFQDQIEIFSQPSVFLVSNVLVRLDSNSSATVFKKDGSSYTLNSSLPKKIKEKGFLFTSDSSTFWLADNSIYQIVINEDRIYAKVVLQNIPLDKTEHNLSSGEYNSETGHFFIGSFTLGLFKIKSNSFQSIQSELSVGNLTDPSPVYYNQVALDDNSILVNNAILIANNESKKLATVNKIGSRSFSYLDKKNNLWYPDENHINVSIKNQIRKIDLTGAIRYETICAYNDSLVFISNPDSLISIQNYEIKKKYSRENLGLEEDVNINYILKGDKDNTLNILTDESIYIYDISNNTSRKVDNLPSANYRIMHELSDSLSFIGTYGQGYYIKKGDEYVSMPLDLNEYLRFAHMALCDEDGHVWISTNNGLFRLPLEELNNYINGTRKDLFYYYYDTSSGLMNNEFNGGCQSPAIKLKNGNFSFSNMYGLVQFNPLEVPTNFPNQNLVFCNLNLDGHITDSIPELLTLSQDVKNIQVEVSTAFYGHIDNLILEYRVADYSDNWQTLDKKRFVVLQNLSYGDHHIEIRKRIGFGAEDFDYLNYTIHIHPYYYQTFWFRFLMCLVSLALLFYLVKWYERYNIQKNINLEEIIKQSTKTLNLTNHNLKDQIRQNELFQSILVHDIKSPIRFITSNSELLHHHWHELDDELKLTNLHHIHDASANIGNFIEETLLWMKIQKGELKIKSEEFKVLPLLQGIIDLYKTYSKIINGDVKLLVRCTHELSYISDPHLLATILRNLLANSIKYTKKGSIELFAIKSIDGKLSMGCSDTGVGMSQLLIDQLLSKEYQGNDIREDSCKMGFVIIKDITKTLNGLLTISSEVNSGTKVSVEFGDTITNK